MKKGIALVLSLLLLLLAGCGDTSSTVTGSADVASDGTTTETEAVSLAEQIEVTEYSYAVQDLTMYYILFLKNNADTTVRAEVNLTAKDSAGNMVGAYSDTAYAIAPGQTSCVWTSFDDPGTVETVEYTMTASEEPNYRSIFDTVTLEYNPLEDKVVVSATNNDTQDAEYVRVVAVYLSGGEAVRFSEGFIGNDDLLLPAGATLSAELDYYADVPYEDVVIAFDGRFE